MDLLDDSNYNELHLLVWDITPLSPIQLAPWDLNFQSHMRRVAELITESAARIMVF